MKIKSPKCPKCGDYLDYDPNYNIWKCLWSGCDYEKPIEKDEGNPILLSVFGSKEKN